MGDVDVTPALTAAAALLGDISAWVDAGTLLGMWRDNRLIPHDTDLDWAVAADPGVDWEDPLQHDPTFDLIRTIDWRGLPMQRAYQHPSGVVVDLYYYWRGIIDGDAALTNVNDVGLIRVPTHLVDDLRVWWWRDVPVKIPPRTDEYLLWRYGADWRTPSVAKRPWAEDAACLQQ
jgi:hypothetical protein